MKMRVTKWSLAVIYPVGLATWAERSNPTALRKDVPLLRKRFSLRMAKALTISSTL